MNNVTPIQKYALVTGGGSGIGRAVALALQEAGYAVAITGRRWLELDGTAELGVNEPPMLCIPSDVRDPGSVRGLFERVQEVFGRLDLLFNNAGIALPGRIEDLSLARWQSVVDINLTGAFLCTRAAFRIMKDQTPMGGRIINNGSISAHSPRPNSLPYTATKHAITGLTKSTSLDGRKYDIACSQLDIGNAATELAAKFSQGVEQANGQIAAEPVMDVQLVADAVLYMAGLPLDANVQTMTLMATKMPFIGRG
jgi:NAD(P)-dependent dehydrogenase (short-subunit alcohol dehydrogenase family)